MSDYTELVKALRERKGLLCYGESACPENCVLLMNHGCYTKLHIDAAAAIEELQAEVDKWTHNATLEQSKAIANFESYCKLKEQMPKRGERTINPYESTWAIENGYI